MSTIFGMLEKLQRVNLETEIPVIIQRNKEVMANLNRDQLKHGKTSLGDEVTPGYFFLQYSIEKNKQNSLAGFGTPDLFLTGAFQRGFYAQVKAGTTIIFGSTDMKTGDLERKYTNKIFGLTMDSKERFALETVMPEIRNYITGITGLKFS